MKIHFNSIGIITNVQTDEDSLRQGSVGTVLETTFEGINNNYYSAKLNFTRSDGTSISNVAMLWDSEDTETFKFVFEDPWFFALSGATTITVFLYDAEGKVISNGQYRFYIEPTDYNEEPTITINQFNALMTALAGKVGVPTSSVFVSELPEKGESGVFYVVREGENNTNIYVYNANTEDYVWVGTNDLNLGNYTTKEEQSQFEAGINAQVEQIRGEVTNPFVVVANISDLPSTNQGKIYVVSANNKWYYWNGSEYVAGTDFVEAGLTNEEITDYTALNQTFYQYILTRYTNGDHRPFFMNIESVANWVGSQEQVLPAGKAFGWYDATSGDIIVITNCGVSAISNNYETRPIVNYNSLAERVIYDNSNSGLEATNVQGAIDETKEIIGYGDTMEYKSSSETQPSFRPISSTFNGWAMPFKKSMVNGDLISKFKIALSLDPSPQNVVCAILDENRNILKSVVANASNQVLTTFELKFSKALLPDYFYIAVYCENLTETHLIAPRGTLDPALNIYVQEMSGERVYYRAGSQSWSSGGTTSIDQLNQGYLNTWFIIETMNTKQLVGENKTNSEFTNNSQFGKELYPNINLFNINKISSIGRWFNHTNGNLETYPYNQYIQNYCHSDFIEIEGGKTYTYSGGNPNYPTVVYAASYCFYDENKIFISGSSIAQEEKPNGVQLQAPANAKYITLSFVNLSSAQYCVQLEKGSNKTAYQPYYGDLFYLNNVVIKAGQVEGSSIKYSYIKLPEKYDLVVGDTFQLFYKGILDVRNYNEYDIDLKCDVGKFDERKFYLTPSSENVGTHDLTVILYDKENKELERKTVILNIVEPMVSPSIQKNVLCIGDSLTAGGQWVNELYRRLTQTSVVDNIAGLGLTNIKFIGKKTTALGAGYEGVGGWTIDNYLSTTESPFAYDGAINFSAYCQELGVPTIDEVYILLNWNTTFWSNEIYTTRTMQFINLLKAFNPNVKIVLLGIQIPSYDGIGDNYGCSRYEYSLNSYRLARKFVFNRDDLLAQMAKDNDLYHISIAGQFDTEYNMPMIDRAVNTRNTTQIKEGSNGVHPADSGYYQIADAVYRWFNANN